MNFQILPHWCKKFSLILFIIFTFLDSRDDAIKGFYDGANNNDYGHTTNLQEIGVFSLDNYLGENVMAFIGIMVLVSLLIHILSKEKIEDEFINKLRLESYQLSFLGVTFIALIFELFDFNKYTDIETVISSLLLSYTIIFAIKKNNFRV